MNNILYDIKKLTEIPSPTGDTYAIMGYLRNEIENLGYTVHEEKKGSLYVELEGIEKVHKRLVTSHVDTLGAMVKEIKSNGRLSMSLIGSFNFNAIEGEYCQIHTQSGKVYTGTILMHQTSVHVYADAGTASRNQENMEIRLDEVVANQEDVGNLDIQVGDFISFNPRTDITESGFIKSRHLDDKVCVAIMLDLLKFYKNEKLLPKVSTIFYFSNNEEIGYGANSYIPENVNEYLALDMGAMGDGQTTDEYSVSICAKDKSGPYHKLLKQHFSNVCVDHNIPYKLDIYPYYGSDASVAMKSGADVRHGLFGPGIDSSHAYERTHISSIRATSDLLREYLFTDII